MDDLHKVQVIVLTSLEAIENFLDFIDHNQDYMKNKTFIVVSQALVDKLAILDMRKNVVLTDQVSDESIVDAIQKIITWSIMDVSLWNLYTVTHKYYAEIKMINWNKHDGWK